MIRKFTFGVFAAALALLASCNKAEVERDGELTIVNFTVDMPVDVSTKAYGDGSGIDKVWYYVYEKIDETYSYVQNASGNIQITDGSADLPIGLYVGKTYRLVFFAQKEVSVDGQATPVYSLVPSDLTGGMKINVPNSAENFEIYDAFVCQCEVTVSAGQSLPVQLIRPFAQLNILCTETDWNNSVTLGRTPSSCDLTLSIPSSYDIFTGESSESVSKTITCAALPTESVAGSKYIAMAYVLPASANITLKVDVKDAGGVFVSREIGNVPLKRNQRTVIKGNLMTGTMQYSVSLSTGITDAADSPVVVQ